MSILPEVSEKKAIQYKYFPTAWQAVVWRNWGYVPVERIADALQATVGEIKNAAEILGLNPDETVEPEWEKRGFLTIIRDNWHLCTYEQIMTLLNITDETLAFILKEDDFMWCKLGDMKPEVEAPKYQPLSGEQLQQTQEIATLLNERFALDNTEHDNAFAFIGEYQQTVEEPHSVVTDTQNLRMVYPYFALYGDALIDESIDPLPDALLEQYAKAGVNGVWMQMVLYQLVEYPFDPSLSKGWEIRIKNLRKLVARAKKYGIGIYPYLNEPRAMSDAFFQKYPHLRGSQEGDFWSVCTSNQEVKDYLYNGVRKLFEQVPDLAGFLTITMSENLTNCYSRSFGQPIECPRCKDRERWEVVSEINNLMAKGAHDVAPNAKVVVWIWGWDPKWADKAIAALTEGQILQCNSEVGMEFCIGGIEGYVSDYTMSMCGPGNMAKQVWKAARASGLQVSAKVQMNNTWEMAVVPYIPVFDKIAQHVKQLKEQGVQHLQASWTLGGSPSPNLRLVSWLMEDKGTVQEFLVDWLGEKDGNAVNKAQQKISQAFSNFPFNLGVVYYAPQNFGPMAPFFLEDTGYEASMVGFPYDDLEKWAAIYPIDIFENQFRMLCEEWAEGVECFRECQNGDVELAEVLRMAEAILCHYQSTYHHIQFVKCRRKEQVDKQELLRIIRLEIETVQTLIKLRLQDSRIGYESSNHYFYSLQDLKEKLINLVYCERKLEKND